MMNLDSTPEGKNNPCFERAAQFGEKILVITEQWLDWIRIASQPTPCYDATGEGWLFAFHSTATVGAFTDYPFDDRKAAFNH